MNDNQSAGVCREAAELAPLAGDMAVYLRPWQVYALCALGAGGGVLCFWLWAGAAGLGPFAGMLIGAALPFAGAMVAAAK